MQKPQRSDRPTQEAHEADAAWPAGDLIAAPADVPVRSAATTQARDGLAPFAFGLVAIVLLLAAYFSADNRASALPNWAIAVWQFSGPVLMAMTVLLGFSPGRSRLMRWLAGLTVVAYALPTALERWDLPVLDGVELKVTFGVILLAALTVRSVRRMLHGRRGSAV